MNFTRTLKIAAGIAVSTIFLFLALRGIDAEALWRELSRTTPLPLIIAVIVFLTAFIVRGMRWRVMLQSSPHCPRLRELISAIFIGYAANGVLPLRAGEFVRSFALSRRSEMSAATALASIVLERVLDGLTLLAMLATLILLQHFPNWVTGVAFGALALFGGGIAFLIVVYHLRQSAITAATALLTRLGIRHTDAVTRIITRLLEGHTLLASPRRTTEAILLSFLIWALECVTYWFVGLSLGLALSPWAVLFCLVVINFGLTLPSSPGFIGTFEYAGVLALGVYGFSHDEALGFTLVLHAIFLVVLVTVGFAFAWVDHGGFRTLTRARMNAEEKQRSELP